MPHASLPDRATLHVLGDPASDFLQNLVTSDVDAIEPGEMRPSALLTPQGKILFDFLVGRLENGFRIDVAAGARGDLAKRLTLYRLRTKIEIRPSDETVAAIWEAGAQPKGALVDRRFPDRAVYRLYGAEPNGAADTPDDFAAFRIRSGVAEAERDFPASDVFPHDVLLDQNGGVSFRKGCYVGQEVVSRMQHRGTARRRLMLVEAERHLTPGAEIRAGEKAIGTVLSATGTNGMALVRIDRVAAAMRADQTLSADGTPVDLTVPNWAGYTLPAEGSGADEA